MFHFIPKQKRFYNKFFWKFHRSGYIGTLTMNGCGDRVFNIDFNNVDLADQAIEYINQNNFKYLRSSINKTKVMVLLF